MMNRSQTARAIALAMMSLACLEGAVQVAAAQGPGKWTMSGQDLTNARNQPLEHTLNVDNVAGLQVAWSVDTLGDVSATPAVDGKFVYVPDFGGKLFKIERETGVVVWARSISEYTGVDGDISRTTPAIHGDLLIIGDQGGRKFSGASVIAVHKVTGDLVWVKKVEDHPSSIITQSATVFGNRIFVGVSSAEESHAAFIPGYQCCTFNGSLLALDVTSGDILWKTYTTGSGFSGNAVWGSAPAIDLKRNQIYIATGNNYSAPDSFLTCVADAGDDADAQRACLEPYDNNLFDSVVALDMKTGAINWSTAVIPFDVWTVECVFEMPGCPDPEGPDFDFGQAPILYSVGSAGERRDLVGVGQKSGVYWSLDAATGEIVWNSRVDPGGNAGGMMWGSACDGERIYTASANGNYAPWTLPDGTTAFSGIWSALDPATGDVLWQTANPTGYRAGGAVSVANGVVYACSQDPDGYMFAMHAVTGEILWSFASGGSCNGGPAIAGGTVYWGSGYAGFGPPNTSNFMIYAFDAP